MILVAFVIVGVVLWLGVKSVKKRVNRAQERPGAVGNRVVRTSLRDCRKETL